MDATLTNSAVSGLTVQVRVKPGGEASRGKYQHAAQASDLSTAENRRTSTQRKQTTAENCDTSTQRKQVI
ncbi:hypothetical protein [Rosistilla oblonga]|uniref:hypothetical protein n=1 Tax=Rosistilla oblonga TaxID=2527990 RepID=UPI003A96A997